jgi:hypothetical protein
LNYDDIKEEIVKKIEILKKKQNKNTKDKNDYELKLNIDSSYKNKIWFYS